MRINDDIMKQRFVRCEHIRLVSVPCVCVCVCVCVSRVRGCVYIGAWVRVCVLLVLDVPTLANIRFSNPVPITEDNAGGTGNGPSASNLADLLPFSRYVRKSLDKIPPPFK